MGVTPSSPNNPVADCRFTWGRWWATSINRVAIGVAFVALGISFLKNENWVDYFCLAYALYSFWRAGYLYYRWEDKARRWQESGGYFFIPSPTELWQQNKSYAIYIWFRIFLYTAFALFGIGLAIWSW